MVRAARHSLVIFLGLEEEVVVDVSQRDVRRQLRIGHGDVEGQKHLPDRVHVENAVEVTGEIELHDHRVTRLDSEAQQGAKLNLTRRGNPAVFAAHQHGADSLGGG